MPTLLIAAASALLLAAVVTEAVQRFFPDSYFALLVITFIALLINGLFNARLRQTQAVDPQQTKAGSPSPKRSSQAQQRSGKSSARGEQKKDRGEQKRDRGEQKKDRGEQDRSRKQEKPKQDTAGSRQPASSEAEASAAPAGPTETGTVKWFNRSKGYGFIIRDNGEEIFVHQRSIVRDNDSRQRPVLRDGQKVSYVVSHQEKGAQAEHVQGLD